LCADVADLELPGLGHLECRPIHPAEQICYIPPETWEERVGYVVVQVDESLQFAKLLGFVPTTATEELPLSQLQPLEDLIEHLGQLQKTPITTAVASVSGTPARRCLTSVNLSQWFGGIFDVGWETVEFFWTQPELKPAYAFRSGETLKENASNQKEAFNRRAKMIDLGIQIANQPVMLIVEIRPEADQQTSIRLQLHPTGNQIYLISGVQLTVLDESGAIFLEAQARSADNYIQLQFKGETGEHFGVKVSLNDVSVTENFII
jgi:hypothetical protein